VDEREWLTERFEEHRTGLRAVAYRMLDWRDVLMRADLAGDDWRIKVEAELGPPR
jgi:RNA polymerase sigma-70 factor (ECF subfamily)